ncbi:MAG: protein-tyrosine phosphatase family protein [Pyrinomonadaceae bacterium]
MIAEVYWTHEKFPGRIALVARPRGGEWLKDEAAAWAEAGLDTIVSMLDDEEIKAFELQLEAEFCAKSGIEFFSFPVKDRGVPELNQEFRALTERLKASLLKGQNIGIHCRQSIGRAPFLAAVLMTMFGIEPKESFRQLGFARGVRVPETPEQRELVERFAEEFAAAPA